MICSTTRLTEPMKIGKSNWFLHTVIDTNIILKRSFLNIALSNLTTIASDIRNINGSFEWIPHAGRRYNPILAKELYVTRILGIRIIGKDEVLVYFVAAPISTNSQRYFILSLIFY
jgi:hypothetical protein